MVKSVGFSSSNWAFVLYSSFTLVDESARFKCWKLDAVCGSKFANELAADDWVGELLLLIVDVGAG